jgi:hypothetical protein
VRLLRNASNPATFPKTDLEALICGYAQPQPSVELDLIFPQNGGYKEERS